MTTPPTERRVPQDDIRGADQLPDAVASINAFARVLASDPGRLASAMQCLTCKGKGVSLCEECHEGIQEKDRWDPALEEHHTTSECCMTCDGDYEDECGECAGEGVVDE